MRVGSLLLVLATLGGVAFYARRRGKGSMPAAPNAELRVLGTTRVGPKASAVVVEVSGKRLLLGVTEQAVSTLAWLDDEPNAALDDGREASGVTARTPSGAQAVDDVAAAGPSGFLRLLRNAVGTRGVVAPNAARPAAPVDEVVEATRDEVRLSRREPEESLTFEGQVLGLARRRKDTP
jgi:flagellar biosynthetic protein FliO